MTSERGLVGNVKKKDDPGGQYINCAGRDVSANAKERWHCIGWNTSAFPMTVYEVAV